MKRCACGQYPDVCARYGHRVPVVDCPVCFAMNDEDCRTADGRKVADHEGRNRG